MSKNSTVSGVKIIITEPYVWNYTGTTCNSATTKELLNQVHFIKLISGALLLED